MPKAFWAGWAAAIVLALVLPLAISALLPNANQFGSLGTECRHDAEQLARQAGSSFPSFWPLSTSVHACSQDGAGDVAYVATVKRVGPYGISFAEVYLSHGKPYTSHEREVSWSTSYSGPLIALAFGIAFISLPFIVAVLWVHGSEILRLMPEPFWWSWVAALALATIMAFVVPIVTTSDANGIDAACAERVRQNVVRETPYVILPFPMEVRQASCPGDPLSEPTSGSVVVRGPYGIQIAQGEIRGGGIYSLNADGVGQALLLVIAGLSAACLPFTFALATTYLRRRRLRLASA